MMLACFSTNGEILLKSLIQHTISCVLVYTCCSLGSGWHLYHSFQRISDIHLGEKGYLYDRSLVTLNYYWNIFTKQNWSWVTTSECISRVSSIDDTTKGGNNIFCYVENRSNWWKTPVSKTYSHAVHKNFVAHK